MKHSTVLLFILFSISTFAQQTYYRENKFWMASPGAYKSGLYGFDNPAVLTYQSPFDLYFTGSDENRIHNEITNTGLFIAVPNFGLGVVNEKFNGVSVTDYKLSAAFGSPSFSLGRYLSNSSKILSLGGRRARVLIGRNCIGIFASKDSYA